jgi:small-conductance mechanosensitive channel
MDSNLGPLQQIGHLFELQKIVVFVIGLAILVLIARVLKNISGHIINQLPSKRLLILQIVTIIIFLIYIIGGIVLFYGAMQPSREMLLAIGGSIAVAVGLALKDLVSSLVAGLVLLFDQPFQVGDRVTFDGEYGEIKSIGLRTVRLVTLDDSLVTIPNSRFLTDVVASSNDGEMDMMVTTEFHIDLNTNIALAKKVINEILITSKYVYLKKPLAIFASEKVINHIPVIALKVKVYVLDAKYENLLKDDITCRVTEYFATNNIKRPTYQPLV